MQEMEEENKDMAGDEKADNVKEDSAECKKNSHTPKEPPTRGGGGDQRLNDKHISEEMDQDQNIDETAVEPEKTLTGDENENQREDQQIGL